MMAGGAEGPLRLGFVGGSLKSAVGYTHWVASQLDRRWEVVAGCFSRTPSINHETARTWHVSPERTYETWQDMAKGEADTLDAVVVLTPTPDHAGVVAGLLRAGFAVICEKAMTSTLAGSREVKQALEETGGFLAVTFNYSGYPMVRVLRRYVRDGWLGKLTQMQIEMPSDAFIQAREKMAPQEWRLADGEIPTILLDLAVHVQHLTAFLADLAPRQVMADFHHDSIFDAIIDDASLWVRYDQDFRASMWVSKSALGSKNGLKLRLFGDQGSAEWVQEDPERLHLFKKDSQRLSLDRSNSAYPDEIRERFKPGHPAGFVEAFANLYEDIADALTDHKAGQPWANPYVYGWAHAHEGLALLEGASRSHASQQWIVLGDGEGT